MIAILVLHILVALTGLVYSVYLFFRPTKTGVKIVYGLLALTIISGSYLIYTKPAHITQTCIEGLVYIGVMLAGIFVARHKLAKQST